VQRPLATVVIGGVLSSTLLSLLILPVLLDLLVVGRSRTREAEEQGASAVGAPPLPPRTEPAPG
jgi:Putative silver efflux pump